MTNYHHFLLLAPPPTEEERKEIGSLLQFSVPIMDGRAFTLSLLGQQSHTINAICVTIPDSDGRLSEKDSDRVSRLSSHMLSILRLTYDVDCAPLYLGDGYLSLAIVNEDRHPARLPAIVRQSRNNDFQINFVNVENTFTATLSIEETISLLTESQFSLLPLQYKFLALYKVLELESHGKRLSAEIRAHLSSYEDEFGRLGVSTKRLENFLPEYRAKCAHIHTGSPDDLGIVGLASADVVKVMKFLPLFRRIAAELVQQRHAHLGVTFSANPSVTPAM